jgi:hypothetical protein
MESAMNQKKIEPWRIIVFVIAVAFIIGMWVKKDIAEIYATVPAEQVVPLIVTTVAVSLVKVAVIALGIYIIQWIAKKIKTK